MQRVICDYVIEQGGGLGGGYRLDCTRSPCAPVLLQGQLRCRRQKGVPAQAL